MTEQQPVICQNCHTEMEPGKKTRSKVMEWTEYTCPNGCSPWSEGKPLPGHEPVFVVPKTDADAESFADDLLAEVADDEEMPEDIVGDLVPDEEEVAKVEDNDA